MRKSIFELGPLFFGVIYEILKDYIHLIPLGWFMTFKGTRLMSVDFELICDIFRDNLDICFIWVYLLRVKGLLDWLDV